MTPIKIGIRVLFLLSLISFSSPAHAYVGPGAGFAFASSFFILFLTIALAFFVLLTWPVRWALRSLRGRKALAKARVKKVVVLGLDGQDPELTQKWIDEGVLPNFKKLAEEGSFVPLATSLLAESPVAWSSFATGANPGKHRIYDFLVPNRKSHLPELSSAGVRAPTRSIRLGKYRVPLGKPAINVGQKSKPFWNVLGEHGVFSTILRVPISFPPQPFHGLLLSAMCAPDLKGSQGIYFYYSTNETETVKLTSGVRVPARREEKRLISHISGPENTMLEGSPEMRIELVVAITGDDSAEIKIGKEKYAIRRGEYSPWVELLFKPGLGVKVRGIARFLLMETSPHIRLYMTPIHISPENPALPISHPLAYSVYLAKTQGPFATLGVAEDTSALNEGIIDEEAFLRQTWDIHEERERMFFDALEKTDRGAVVCVFDATDRIQHMFFRFMDENHPASAHKPEECRARYKDEIKRLYIKMDDLLGRTLLTVGQDQNAVLMVMSDHGFKPFRREVNLNTWLWKMGYLILKENKFSPADMLQAVDWTQTRAYAVGFGGIYLNLKGREARGIIPAGDEAEALTHQIKTELTRLTDPVDGTGCVRHVYEAREAFSGPYVKDAPDLIVGFRPGYRVAWASVTGGLDEEVFKDNTRPWSGDHNFNPPDVPGMLFCNRKLAHGEAHIMDLGPTILDLFGIVPPAHCDGKPLLPASTGR